ncbi:MAG: glutamine--tRNA ligase, partial [Gelidibacter sp.]|nr:glutamine--tRNA ligase [Gelidibacter sp.]
GTLHWVSIKHAVKAEVRDYDRLFMDEAPDSHEDKDFMEFINPESLKLVTAFVEPSLKEAKNGDRFQFQRIGYFNVDKDATPNQLIFNKTVGLRDSWEKQKPAQNTNQSSSKPQQNQPQRKAIDVIQQLGKKYTNLPDAKQQKVKSEIQELAKNVSYDELQPLFNTATKKTGTRIAVMITLGVLFKKGLQSNTDTDTFISNALEDKEVLLVNEAKNIS